MPSIFRFGLWISLCCIPSLGFSQHVGVNTQTPQGALDIRSAGNTSSTHALLISNTASDTMLVVRDDGKVGIGTTQPAFSLDVQSAQPVAARFGARVEGQPAIQNNELTTLGQVQAMTVAASGAVAAPTMFSATTSSSGGYFTDGLIFCRNLSEGGFTDWRMPTMEDWTRMIQNDAVALPSYTAARYYWMNPSTTGPVSTSAWYQLYISNPNLSTTFSHYFTSTYSPSSSSVYTFCVR
jgi:hypothetical protein